MNPNDKIKYTVIPISRKPVFYRPIDRNDRVFDFVVWIHSFGMEKAIRKTDVVPVKRQKSLLRRFAFFLGMDSDYSTRLLELVSRSFALCIPRLPAKVRLEVGNYYLLCRYLDSIEDSRLDRKHREKAFKRFLELLRSRDPARLEKLNADVLPLVISER